MLRIMSYVCFTDWYTEIMPPTEGHMSMPQGHMGMGVGTISLATLIDFIVQRTYHELTVLSEM